MARFDAAMMHNSFYVVRGFELAKRDSFVVDYYQHWRRCPDCAASIQGNETQILSACQQVVEWQTLFRESLKRGYGGKEPSYRYDLSVEYLGPKILPGIRPHPPIKCYACCEGCAVAKYVSQIWPVDVRTVKGFMADTLRKRKAHTTL